MRLSPQKVREQRRELLDLLFHCDPAALIFSADQSDEYDCLVGSLLGLLHNGAGEKEVATFLETDLRTHFGSFDTTRARETAAKVKAGFDKSAGV